MTTIIAAIVAPFIGFGTVALIFAHLLSKSNNIGGETAAPEYYAAAPKFDTRINGVSRSEVVSCSITYKQELEHYAYPDPDEEVHVITGKEATEVKYKKISKKEKGPKILQEQYDFDEDLPPIDGPIFKPLDR